MKLGCLSSLALIAVASAAGVGYLSFWWALIPAFLAGSSALTNEPYYSNILQANEEGRLIVFPTMLALSIAPYAGLAVVIYWAFLLAS